MSTSVVLPFIVCVYSLVLGGKFGNFFECFWGRKMVGWSSFFYSAF